MPPKFRKVSKSPKRSPPAYIAPRPKKPITWSQIGPGLGMLRYRPQIREARGLAVSRRIMNSPACVVAPVYAAVEEFAEWSSALVDNVFQIAKELHRKTLQQLKLPANSNYPIQCVCPTLFVNYNKVTILVRSSPMLTPLHGGLTSTPGDDQVRWLDMLMNDHHGVMLQCGSKTFSYWKDRDKFFAFIPDGLGAIEFSMPVLLKSNNLLKLLEHCLKAERGLCYLYTLKVLSKEKIDMNLHNLNKEISDPPDTEEAIDDVPSVSEVESEEPPPPADTSAKAKRDRKQVDEAESAERGSSEDVLLTLSSDYIALPGNRGILAGKEYCKDPDRILHTNIAAAMFLHHVPANLWTSSIIRDIMKLGKIIFYHSDELLQNEDWMDRIKLPIKFMNKYFSLNFEKMVFGGVQSVDSDILSIEHGLIRFFQGNDTGLVVGPQMVLVWQQKNNYFMFDPKERDGLGRKWTKMLSASLGSTASAGSACVTWYRSPKKLAEVYMDNIALKHRKDPYRIIKIRVFEKPSKANDEGDWIGVSSNRWILVGTKSLCDYSYAEDTLRIGKALCIGVSALIHAIDTPEEDWENATIDKVLSEGIELLKLSLGPHAAKQTFTLMSIKRIVDIAGRRVRLNIVDCMIQGEMLAEGKAKGSVPLEIGLNKLFDYTKYGIITVKDIALAIWRGTDNCYYLFYPYEKPLGLPPLCLCANENDLPPMGIANAMRFKTITDLFSFLISCLNTKDSDEYCLNPLDISLSDAADRPPLLEYEEFGVSGAIMRPWNDLHEGHEVFGARADKQTFANLLTALGFNRINSSTNWTKEDLADILKIGDKIFCKIFMGLPECQSRDYQLQWDDIVPVIGMNKFTFTRQPISGVFQLPPELFDEEAEHELVGPEESENEEGIEAQDDDLFVPSQEGEAEKVDSHKDLKGILQAWERKKSDHHEAVIESDFFKVAIWKRDNLYFAFDPKASGENGELTDRRIEKGKDNAADDILPLNEEEVDERTNAKQPSPILIEKRTYMEFDNEGSAYTAWFSDFDEFYNHILMKIPEDYKHGKFILHELVLTNTPLGTDDLENQLKPGFRNITPGHLLLRGSITRNNPSLKNRKQEHSDCLVSLAFAKITPSNKITTTLLDVVLKYGDRLHTKSLKALKRANNEQPYETQNITLDDIPRVFTIYKIKFTWKVTNTVKGNASINELKKATGKLGTIEAGVAALLDYKGYLMALWRSKDGYFLYDPFETNPNGWFSESGLPSLSKFPKTDNMFSYLMSKFGCLGGSNTFTMYLIGVQSSPVEDLSLASNEPEDVLEKTRIIANIPKDQQVFQVYQGDMRILKSPLTFTKVPQHCLALAALVHSRLQFVELWDSNISHRISFLSKYLLHKSHCDIETPSSISCDDIRCSFTIDNDILCHVTFTKNMQGPIHSVKRTEIVGVNLKNALTLFFRNCQQVLITIPGSGTAFALWKDTGSFYLFGVNRDKPETFVIASETLSNLHDTLLKGTDSEGDANNWYELRSVNVTTVPIKEGICKPLAIAKKPTEEGHEDNSAISKESHYYDHLSEKPESSLTKPKLKEFVEIAEGVEVLYSKNILRSHRFYGTRDFFSSLQAACVECCALSKVKSPSLWTKKTLTQILSAGINLYINAVAVKGTTNLQISDFNGNIFISNHKLEVYPLPPKLQGATKNDLLLSLTWILRNYQTAYLHTENFCFTLISEKSHYYLYYPGSCELLCEDIRNECSCLIRFCTISDLLDRLLANESISLCENIFIGPIDVSVKQ